LKQADSFGVNLVIHLFKLAASKFSNSMAIYQTIRLNGKMISIEANAKAQSTYYAGEQWTMGLIAYFCMQIHTLWKARCAAAETWRMQLRRQPTRQPQRSLSTGGKTRCGNGIYTRFPTSAAYLLLQQRNGNVLDASDGDHRDDYGCFARVIGTKDEIVSVSHVLREATQFSPIEPTVTVAYPSLVSGLRE
jgi:hypothetical protein